MNFFKKMIQYKIPIAIVSILLILGIFALVSNDSRRKLKLFEESTNITSETKKEIKEYCQGREKPLLILNPIKYWKEQADCWYKQLKVLNR
jgi:hypothetical protein